MPTASAGSILLDMDAVDECKEQLLTLNSNVHKCTRCKQAVKIRKQAASAIAELEQALQRGRTRQAQGSLNSQEPVNFIRLCRDAETALRQANDYVQDEGGSPVRYLYCKQSTAVLRQLNLVKECAAGFWLSTNAKTRVQTPGGTRKHTSEDPLREIGSTKLHYSTAAKVGNALYVPSTPSKHSLPHTGFVWWYLAPMFGARKLIVYDASSCHSQEIIPSVSSAVSLMHLDRMLVWMVHTGGHVVVWNTQTKSPCSAPFQVFRSNVCAISTDGQDKAWLGSKSGNICVVNLRRAASPAEGNRAGTGSLQLVNLAEFDCEGRGAPHTPPTRHPRHSSLDDVPEVLASAALHSMYSYQGGSAHARCPVLSLLVWGDRLWSSGGKDSEAQLREWSLSGHLRATHMLHSMGPVQAMRVFCNVPADGDTCAAPADASSHGQLLHCADSWPASTPQAGVSSVSGYNQLLTSHNSGRVLIWQIDPTAVTPLCTVVANDGRAVRGEPISLCIHYPLQAALVGYSSGHMLLYCIPDMDTIIAAVHEQKGRLPTVTVNTVDIKAHKSGLHVVTGALGAAVTVSRNGSVRLWPQTVLQQLGEPSLMLWKRKGCVTEATIGPDMLDQSKSCESQGVSLQEALTAIPDNTDDEEGGTNEGTATQALNSNELPGINDGSTLSSTTTELSSLRRALPNTNQFVIAAKDIRFLDVIGTGAFGQVHRGLLYGSTEVAVKKLQMPSDGHNQFDLKDPGLMLALKALHREVGILGQVRHKNVLLFVGVCLDPPCIVTEYCERNSLYDVLALACVSSEVQQALTWERRLNMAIDAAKGMAYLHSNVHPILHRDLKSPNLLVDTNWQVKVADFGLSRILDSQTPNSSVGLTNPRWLAPEVIRSQQFSMAADVYSFGIILWELMTWEEPYSSLLTHQIVLGVVDRDLRPCLPVNYQQLRGGSFCGIKDYVTLMQECWSATPACRPTFVNLAKELKSLLKRHQSYVITAAASSSFASCPPTQLTPTNSTTMVATAHPPISDELHRPPPPPQPTPLPPLGTADIIPDDSPPRTVLTTSWDVSSTPLEEVSACEHDGSHHTSHSRTAAPSQDTHPLSEGTEIREFRCSSGSGLAPEGAQREGFASFFSASESASFLESSVSGEQTVASGEHTHAIAASTPNQPSGPFPNATSDISTGTSASDHTPFASFDAPPTPEAAPRLSSFSFPELDLPDDDSAFSTRLSSGYSLNDDVDLQLAHHKLIQSWSRKADSERPPSMSSPITSCPPSTSTGHTAAALPLFSLSFGGWYDQPPPINTQTMP